MGQLHLNGKVLTMDQSLEDQGVKELVAENGWKEYRFIDMCGMSKWEHHIPYAGPTLFIRKISGLKACILQ